jgi:ATP-dependent Lhr-like helicase
VEGILSRLSVIRLPGASLDAVVRRERLETLAASLALDPGPILAEWLASTGPTPLGRMRNLFGFSDDADVAAALKEVRSVVSFESGGTGGTSDATGTGNPSAACDRNALESLLRQTRKAARPTIRTLSAEALPAFIASIQNLRDRAGAQNHATDVSLAAKAAESATIEANAIEATRRTLNALSGFPALASLWETEILPARVPGYRPEYLDALLSGGEFLWFGTGMRTVAFAPVTEYEAFAGNTASALVEPGAEPLDAWSLKERHGLSIAVLEDSMWAEIWSGAISSQSFEPVRRAAAGGFRRIATASDPLLADTPARGQRRVPLAISGRWKNGAPVSGRWFSLALEEGPGRDDADALELAQVALRAVIRRFGLVCRAVLERELPQALWPALFPAIRRLELSGELVSGRFFDGIDGLQFMGRDAFGVFRDGVEESWLWSVNAFDPASPAGLAVSGLAANLPARLPVNRMTMHGGVPVCVSRRSFTDLDIYIPPDDPLLEASLAFLSEARRRIVMPERRIAIARINGESAACSPYADRLTAMGYDADRGSLTLW